MQSVRLHGLKDMTIAEKIKTIKTQLPENVRLVAATKMNSAERVREAIESGIEICGENRVQEMLEKYGKNAYDGAELQFIGKLQKNKVKYIVGKVSLIQSVDSIALMDEINRAAQKMGIIQDVLLEVNIGREESKSGFMTDELETALQHGEALESVRIKGLMAIPPACTIPAENRPYFMQMKQLFVDIANKKYDNSMMEILSMGMSGDYLEAVSCGSNMVRIGSGIFGPRDYSKQ